MTTNAVNLVAGAGSVEISRRSLLASLSALAVAVTTGCGIGTADDAEAVDAFGAGQPRLGGGTPPLPREASSIYQGPYQLVDDCVLSEDYFQLELGDYNPDEDLIFGYPQSDAYVPEAILALWSNGRNGALVQLYHDWTKGQAWAIAPVKVSDNPVEQVHNLAVGRAQRPDNTIGSLHVFYSKDITTPYTHLKQLGNSTWEVQPDLGWSNCGVVRQCIGPTGGLFVYTFSTAGDKLYWCNVNADDSTSNGVVQLPLAVGDLQNVDSVSVCALSGPDGPWTVFYFDADIYLTVWSAEISPKDQDQKGSAAAWSGLPREAQPTDPATKQPVDLNRIAASFTMDETQPPIMLIEDIQGRTWSLTSINSQPNWSLIWTPPKGFDGDTIFTAAARALPASEGGASTNADKALDLYIRTYDTSQNGPLHNTVLVIHQVDTGNATTDSQRPSFTPAVPLLPNIGALAVPSGRAVSTGFITMDIDGGLQLMTVQPLPPDPATGAPAGQAWVGTAIHLPATESIQMSTYRVQLTLTDAAGLPVVDTPLQVTCAQQIPSMCNGAAVPLGPSGAAFQTNRRGQVTLAIPADGLSCPTLTVSANGARASVLPSADINNYCTGSTSLNQLPPLAAGGNITQTKTLSNEQFASMQIAANGAIDAPSVKPASAGRRGEARRVALVAKPGRTLTAEQQRLGGWFDNFVHDVVQAVKSGAAKVDSAVSEAATEIKYAVVTIGTDIQGLADHALEVTIHDLEDAATVFHSIINQIGAAIVAAIDWLKAAVLGLFADTALLAQQYDTWIHDACRFITSQINSLEDKTNTWFKDQQTAIDTQLQAFKNTHGSTSISKLVPAQQSTLSSTRPTGRVGAAAPAPPNPGGAHSNWLLEKIEQVFDGPTSLPVNGAVEAAFQKLGVKLQTAVADFDGAAKDAIDALTSAITTPKDASTQSLGLFIDAIQLLADGVLTIADGLVDVVLDLFVAVIGAISAILDTTVGDLPIIGALLPDSLAKLTFGQLACLLYAFPAMLAYKLATKGGTPSWLKKNPTATAPSLATRGGAGTARGRVSARPVPTLFGDAESQAFKLMAASTIMTWNAFDLAEAIFAVDGTEPPWWVLVADIVGAAVLGAFTFPATGGADPYTSWPVSQDPSDQALFASYLCGLIMLPTAILSVYAVRAYPGIADEAVRASYAKATTILTTTSGVLSAVFGIVGYATAKSSEPSDYFYTILYALPPTLSPCLLTEGLPPAIVAGCCLVDAVAALYQLFQASLNPS